MKYWLLILFLLAGMVIGSLATAGYYASHPTPTSSPSPTSIPTPTAVTTPTPTPFNEQGVRIEQPLPEAVVQSPLTITGTATGGWFFEAQFPICLVDATGKEIVCDKAQALADWMTSQPVPFRANLNFAIPTSATGKIIIKNDNPSGDPALARSVSLPIRFR